MPKMKGQMSLEMIIGLVILLVVAGVVIGLLVHFLSKENMPNVNDKLDKMKFKSECDKLCEGGDMVGYCSYYFGKGTESMIDLNNDNQLNSRVIVGTQGWPACESRLYCFLYAPCRRMGATSTDMMKKCRRILCDNYLNKYDNNVKESNEAVLDMIRVSTEKTNVPYCSLSGVPEKENWHKRFFPENVCEKEKPGPEPGPSPATLSLTNCTLNNSTTPWSFTCNTSCVAADSVSVRDTTDKKSAEINPTITAGVLTSTPIRPDPTGLAGLKCPDTWIVTLVCKNPDGLKETTMSCS